MAPSKRKRSRVARKKHRSVRSNPLEAILALTDRPFGLGHISRTMDEAFRTRNDRGAAILLASLVEFSLQDAIERVLLISDRKQRRMLFGVNAPLGTFANKIRIGWALRIFGPQTFDNLEKIRVIRNAFAHARTHVSFRTKEIADYSRLLIMPRGETEGDVSTTRKLFASVAFVTSMDLHRFASVGLGNQFNPEDFETFVRPKPLP